MSLILNVITACIRPNNLSTILNSMNTANTPKIQINWHIILDNNFLKYNDQQVETLKRSLTAPPEIHLHFFLFKQSLLDNSPVNPALEGISEGLVCFIDDDNIMHPEYITEIYEVAKNGDPVGILYQQNMGRAYKSYNRHIRQVIHYQIGPGFIDTAQITVSRSLIGNLRWSAVVPGSKLHDQLFNKARNPQGMPHEPDGKFIAALYQKHADKFRIIHKPLCYYNYLSSRLDFS